MKKNKIFFLLALIVSIFSCTDLNEEPVGVLAPEGFFKTERDVVAAFYGVNGRIASETMWGRKLALTIGLMGDDVDIINSGTALRRREANSFTMNSLNGLISSYWPSTYKAICTANTAIEGAESLEDISESKKNALIAEGKFLKSWLYFQLVRLHGDLPYIDKAITDPESVGDISRTPAEEIYADIITDLEFGKQYLPMTQQSRVRISKGTAATMLADVHLFLGNYDEAYNNAKWVIENAASLDYELDADYADIFNGEICDNSKEHIFQADFTGLLVGPASTNLEWWGPLFGVSGSSASGWSICGPNIAIYNSFDDRDYRKEYSFWTEIMHSDGIKPYTEFRFPVPHGAKYNRNGGTSSADGSDSDRNMAIYRYAEVLLIAAEAGNEISGPNAELVGYVNQVRARARNAAGIQRDYPEDVALEGLTKKSFLDLILEERRLEFNSEFKRWWTIKRRQLGDEVFKGPNSVEPHPNFDSSIHYLLPLPQDELDRNENLTQNPGYE